jgi:O-antigen/teichoic acid export membrane protein
MSSFRGNVARIASASAVSQILLFAAAPLLTRLYAPADFGIYAVYSGLHGIFVSVVALKYDFAIILPKERERAIDLSVLTLLITCGLSALALCGLAVAAMVARTPPAQYFAIPVSAVATVAYAVYGRWAARQCDYRWFGRAQVFAAVVNIGVAVLVARWSAGLIVAYVASQFGAVALFYWVERPAWVSVDLRRLLRVAHEYRRFPLYVLPSTLLLTLGTSLPPSILSRMFSMAEVGHFGLANRVLYAPAVLVGSAIAEAFRAEFVARLHRGESVKRFFLRTVAAVSAVGCVAFATMALIGPYFFARLFGARFEQAGQLVRPLAVGALAQFIAQPLYYVFVASGRVREGLIVQFASTVVPLGLMVVGGRSHDLAYTLQLYSTGCVFATALNVALAWRAASRALR